LGGIRIIPEARFAGFFFELAYLFSFTVYVKDNP